MLLRSLVAPLILIATVVLSFAAALGVLLDTIVVRSVLVTALTLDIGRWMWWPGRLARQRDVLPAGPAAARDLITGDGAGAGWLPTAARH